MVDNEDFLISNKLRTTTCKFFPHCSFFFMLKCFGVYHSTIKLSLFSLAKLEVDFFCKLLFTFLLTKITKVWSPHSISLHTELSTVKTRRNPEKVNSTNVTILLCFSQPFKVISKSFQKINKNHLKCCKKCVDCRYFRLH